MKVEVKQQLKEQNYLHLFTEIRYKQVVELMKYAMAKDATLKKYLQISPDFKVNFICDHMIKLVSSGDI